MNKTKSRHHCPETTQTGAGEKGKTPGNGHRWNVSRKQWRWLGLATIMLVSLALRLPWLNADVGNEGFWTYGYFVTDEGYYTSGGRLAVLNGHGLDPKLDDPPTYGAAPAMHYLSALSYRLRGITYDACRWPTMIASATGWSSAFWLASSVTHPLIALAVTLPLSLNPLSLTYERASSSDATFGGFLLLALCLLRSRKCFAYLLGGMAFAFVPAVKASGIGFTPLVFLTTLAMPSRRWVRLGGGLLGYLIGWGALTGIDTWVLRSHESHMDPEKLRWACSMAAGASLPHATWQQAIRAFPIFPRFPVDARMGILTAWCLALPAWGVLSHLARGWSRRLQRPALYVGMLIFGMALSIQINCTERYFLPLIMLTPWLLATARPSVFRWARGKPAPRAVALALASLILLCFFWLGQPDTAGHHPREFITNEYNLPGVCAWIGIWKPLLLTTLLTVAALAPWARTLTGALCAVPIALAGTLLLWHAWPMARLVDDAVIASALPAFFLQQLFLISVLALLFVPVPHCRWRIWYGALGAMFLASYCGTPAWRTTFPILWHRTENVRKVAEELARQLPKNSIVIGNRASSLLRGSRLQLGCCTPNYSAEDFIAKLKRIMSDFPDKPLFLLIDSDHNYHGSYLMKAGKDTIETKVVGAVPLPSAGGKGKTVKVFVVQLSLKR